MSPQNLTLLPPYEKKKEQALNKNSISFALSSSDTLAQKGSSATLVLPRGIWPGVEPGVDRIMN